MQLQEILQILEKLKNPKNALGMARFGIKPNSNVYGIPIPELRKLAKRIGKNNELALKLWSTNIHEARILAGFIGEPEKVSKGQFEVWTKDFDSWDICDQVCFNLFDKTPFVVAKIFELSKRKPEFQKRTAFALMAALAVHDKKMPDKDFLAFFPLIKQAATDERNFVRKAVNWALRQIGKRNKYLHTKAIVLAKEILKIDSKSARWIAKNAIIELGSQKVKNKFT